MNKYIFILFFSITSFCQSTSDSNLGKIVYYEKEINKKEYQIKQDSLNNLIDSTLSTLKENEFYFNKSNKELFTSFTNLKNNKFIIQSNTLNSILKFFNSNYKFLTVDKEFDDVFFDLYLKGDINNPNNRINIEKEICKKLKLKKEIKKENFPFYNINYNNTSFLIPSTKKDYTQVYDPIEKKIKITCKIYQFFNALNGYFPDCFKFESNFEDENYYDFEISVENINKLIAELKFYKFELIENKREINHIYYNKIN